MCTSPTVSFLLYLCSQLHCTFMVLMPSKVLIFTARKRSLRRLCFYRCLSVHTGGACMLLGGVRGSRGACMVAPGGCAWLPRGHAWLPGGMHGCSWEACMVAQGVCVVAPGGCVVAQGAYMVALGGEACVITPGGMHGCSGGHVWLLWGVVALEGMHGCSWGGGMRGI